MVHEKFIYRNGKKYGPYLYENQRVNGKVVTTYKGTPSSSRPLFSFAFIGLLVLVGGFLLLGLPLAPTGKVTASLADTYVLNETLTGTLVLHLQEGEFIPADTLVRLRSGSEEVTLPLSAFSFSGSTEGSFYVVNSSLTGEGRGYGLPGSFPSSVTFHYSFIPLSSLPEVPSPTEETLLPPSPETSSEESTSAQDASPSLPEESAIVEAVSHSLAPAETDVSSSLSPSPSVPELVESPDAFTGEGSSLLTGAVIGEPASSVLSGEVSHAQPLVLEVPAGYRMELVLGSVRAGTRVLSDSVLDISQEGEQVSVRLPERRFGPDTLGTGVLPLSFDVGLFGLRIQDASLHLSLDYEGTSFLAVRTVLPLTDAPLVASPRLLKAIPLQRLSSGSLLTLNLSDFITGADTFTLSLASDALEGTFTGSILTLNALPSFKGATRVTLSALRGKEIDRKSVV